MSDQTPIPRRDPWAKARAAKALKQAGIVPAKIIDRKPDRHGPASVAGQLRTQQQAIAALLVSQGKLIEAITALATAVKTLVETNTPKPFVGLGPTFTSYKPDGRGSEMARFCEEAASRVSDTTAASFVMRQVDYEAATTTDLERFEDDGAAVPRGTEPAPATPEAALADMRLEYAEMAAELDEPPPPPDEWEVWERRLSTFQAQRLWHPSWGPRPGQTGCLVPYEMLNTGDAR